MALKLEQGVFKAISFVYSLDNTKKNLFLGDFLAKVKHKNTNEELKKYKIDNVENWKNKERYLFSLILKDNPHAKDIVSSYNAASKYERDLDKVKLFKHLHTMSKFLSAFPYKEGNFPKKAYKSAVLWTASGEDDKVEDFLSGLKLFVDINTMEDFMSPSIEKRESSTNFIRSKKELAKNKSNKNFTKIGLSLIGALCLTSLAIDTITQSDIAKTVMENAQNFLGDITLINNLSLYVVAAIATYKSFGLAFEFVNKIENIARNRQILNSTPKNFQKNYVDKYTNQCLLRDVLIKHNYEVTNEDNEKYLLLSAFLNEKSVNNKFKVSEYFKKTLGINDKQASRLNSLTPSDIHELITVSSPFARSLMALNKLTDAQKSVVKNLSLLEELKDKSNMTGLFFEQLKYDPKKNKLPYFIIKEIEEMDIINKQLTFLYLNSHKNEEGFYNLSVVRTLRENLRLGLTIEKILLGETSLALKNKVQYLKDNPEGVIKTNFNRVKKIFKGEEKIERYNTSVFNALEEYVKKDNLVNTNIILKEYRPITIMIKDAINLSGNFVKTKIQNIRSIVNKDENNNNNFNSRL